MWVGVIFHITLGLCGGGYSLETEYFNSVMDESLPYFPKMAPVLTEAVLGGLAELPCDLNVTGSEDDPISLVLWYKGESGSPIYTLDARDAPLMEARHFPGVQLRARARYEPSGSPSLLHIEPVVRSDAGMYRCRIEYRRARTDTQDVLLKVTESPKEVIIMDEFGQRLSGLIGPYSEGQSLTLICESEGGDPIPKITWWSGSGELLDDSYQLTPQGFPKNELVLEKLERDRLMATFECQASNSNVSDPVTSSVTLDLNLRPLGVHIETPVRPLTVGEEVTLECRSWGARPPAQLTWWLAGEKRSAVRERVARASNLTTSELRISASPEMSGLRVTCRADNPTLTDAAGLEAIWPLDVYYLPQLTVESGKSVVLEGGEAVLRCRVHANPHAEKMLWSRDGQVLYGDVRKGILQLNDTLVLRPVAVRHAGRYACSAENVLGRAHSENHILNVHYVPRCAPDADRREVYLVPSAHANVSCQVDANPTDVAFRWAANSSADHVVVRGFTSNGTRSVATLAEDLPLPAVLLCWATNAVGPQDLPCRIHLLPAGAPDAVPGCHTDNVTKTSLTISCQPVEGATTYHLELYRGSVLLGNLTHHATPEFRPENLPVGSSLSARVWASSPAGRSSPIVINMRLVEPTPLNSDDSYMHLILGVILGVTGAFALLGIAMVLVGRFQSKRRRTGNPYKEKIILEENELKESKSYHLQGNYGPDIIPERIQNVQSDVASLITHGETPRLAEALYRCEDEDKIYIKYPEMTFSEDIELIEPLQRRTPYRDIDPELEETGAAPLMKTERPQNNDWKTVYKDPLVLSTPV